MSARQRAAEHGEVLREHADLAPVDRAPTGDHAVAVDLLFLHAEVGAAVRDQPIELDEATRIEQQIDPLTRAELAGLVLLGDPLFAAAGERLRIQPLEPRE